MSKTTIYILKLENNKYYIGKSNSLEKRTESHMNGLGSSWTKKYKPISIEKTIENASSFDEDKYTLEYMHIYGIDNVRGGQYASEALDELQRYNIKKSLWAANDCCNQCGRKGHFINNCKFTTDINGENIFEDNENWICEYCNKEYEDKSECVKHEKFCKKIKINSSFNCQYCNKEFETQKGATFHENKYCKNKYEEIFSCQYCDKEFETQKGATFHENVHCQEKFKLSKKKTNNSDGGNKCYRCGRSGHYSGDCYASTHVKGHELN